MAKSACPAITYSDATEAQDEGGDLLSNFAYRMMKPLLEEPNGRIAKKVVQIYYGVSPSASKDVSYSTALMVTATVCLILALGIALTALIRRRNIVANKRSSHTSTCILALVSLTISICFTVASAYIFVRSVVELRTGRNALEKDANSQKGVKDFLTESTQNTICHFDERRPHYEQNAESTLGNVTLFLHNIQTSLNNRSIGKVIMKVKEEILNNLISAKEFLQSPHANEFGVIRSKIGDMAQLVSEWKIEESNVTDVKVIAKALFPEILKLEQHIDAQKLKINESFDSYPSHFNTTHTLISKAIKDFMNAAATVQRRNDFAANSYFNYALALNFIPAIQFMSAVIAIAIIMCCRTRAFTYYLLNQEGCQALMMVALLFALLAGAFVVAYTSAFVCAGLSEDVTAVDILNSSGVDDDTPSPKQPAVDVIRTMKSCQKNYTLFNATGKVFVLTNDVPELDEVVAKIGSALNNSETSIDLQDHIKELKDDVNKLLVITQGIRDQSLNSEEKQFKKEIENKVKALKKTFANADAQAKELYYILTPSARASLFNKISDEVSHVKTNSIYSFMIDGEEEKASLSPRCKPLGNLWVAMGSSYCRSITLPAQDIWPAFVLCIVGSVFLFYGLCKAGRCVATALDDSITEESSLKGSTPKMPPKRSIKKKQKPPKQIRRPSVKVKKRIKKSVKKSKTKKTEEVSPQIAARPTKFDVTQEDEEIILPVKPEVAKQAPPAQMPKVAWDPYEPSVRQHSWKVYPDGKPEPLSNELITSIRDWKPPPASELTAQERERRNLETQDEEEIESPLLQLDLLENKEAHRKKKSKRLGVRDEGANMIIQQDVNEDLPFRAEAFTTDNH